MQSLWVSRKEKVSRPWKSCAGEVRGVQELPVSPSMEDVPENPGGKSQTSGGCHHVVPRCPQAPPVRSPGELPKQSPTTPPARHGMQSHISTASVKIQGWAATSIGDRAWPPPRTPRAEQSQPPLPSRESPGDGDTEI